MATTPATNGEPRPLTCPLVNHQLVKWHLIAAFGWLTLAMLDGLFYATQFFNHWVLPHSEWFSPGRIRMVHTNLVAFGFLVNGFTAMLYWCVPRLTGRPVLSHKLGWVIFYVWLAVITALVIGLHMGQAQAVEWGETPVWLDPVIVVAVVLVAAQFYTPIIQSAEKAMYVSLWYFSAGFVWLGLTYIMGNFFTQYLVPGTGGGPMLGLYIHDLVGLYVTPMGWGMMYFFVPILLRKPIWSHALSLVGFWGLAFFYPLQGIHHFLWSPIPMFAQYGAVVSTIAVEIVVTTVIINFFMTWRGKEESLRDNMAIRWFWIGAFNYFLTCLQCAFQVTLTFQTIIHFTDWVVGHAHLVMFGVFSFWIYGMTDHLWPKLTGRQWWSTKLAAWQFWLIVIGLEVMFLDLTAAGLVQGFMMRALSPWGEILRALHPFWILRTVAGMAIMAGQICLLVNMWATARSSKISHVDTDYVPYEQVSDEVATAVV